MTKDVKFEQEIHKKGNLNDLECKKDALPHL